MGDFQIESPCSAGQEHSPRQDAVVGCVLQRDRLSAFSLYDEGEGAGWVGNECGV